MASQGERLLRLAGYSGQGGLGRNESGIEVALNPTPNVGRGGLGYQPQPNETPTSLASVDWFSFESGGGSNDGEVVELIDPSLQQRLDASKSRLDAIEQRTLSHARQLSNPYEAIKGEGFQNRAAIKIAEIDAMCDGLLHKPLFSMTSPRAGHVLDLCGGPGGFSEYFATRLGWRAHIWGVTLRASTNDWAIHKFNPQASRHVFRPLYGADGSGNMLDSRNLAHIQQTLLLESSNEGVQVVVCDGGFDVQGRENHQERLSQPLIHAQLTLGMSVLAPGGSLVCKLFDTILPYTAALIELAARLFGSIAIVKPHQSRQANSERYLICRDFLKRDAAAAILGIEHVRGPLARHWFDLLSSIDCWPDQTELAQRLLGPLNDDDTSSDAIRAYVAKQNALFGQKQLHALERLHVHIDAILSRRGVKPDHDQQAVRLQCLAMWALPVLDARWIGSVTNETGITSRSLLNYISREMNTTLHAPLLAQQQQQQHFALPQGHISLRVVWFGPYGPVGHWDWVSRKHVPWSGWPCCVQEHTIFLTVCVSEDTDTDTDPAAVYVADAWCLPGMPFLYREPLLARRRLADIFLQTCKDARLRLLRPLTVDDSKKNQLAISIDRKPSVLAFSK